MAGVTPPIRDGDGDAVRGGIASLETVTLHGSKQWIMVRGTSVDSPVLLFLAGGPGGSEFGKTRAVRAGPRRFLTDSA